MNRLRAAELIDHTIFTPALHRSEMAGINMVIKQQDKPLVTPRTESDIASLHLHMSSAWDRKELCGRECGCRGHADAVALDGAAHPYAHMEEGRNECWRSEERVDVEHVVLLQYS